MYTLSQIAKAIDAKLIGDKQAKIEYLLYDSRRIVPSKRSLFFALIGKRDGHRFLNEVAFKGARNFVVSYLPENRPAGNYLLVDNTLKALQRLAEFHRQRFDLEVFAITGSNGKTIVKEWLAFVMSKFYEVVKSPKSYNSQIGVPLSVWEIKDYHQIGIFEAGISKPNEMENLERVIKPKYGIFTNLGDAHQENFSSLQQKLEEKLKLFKNVETIFFNADDEIVYKTIMQKFTDKNLICWSKYTNVNCDLKIVKIYRQKEFTIVYANYLGRELELKLKFNDYASIYNAITVWLVALTMLGVEKVQQVDFSCLPKVEMRLELIRGVHNSLLINDTYNYDLTSLQIALDYLSQQNSGRKTAVILSDIEGVGHNKDTVYQKVADLLLSAKVDKFIGVGSELFNHSELFKEVEASFYSSTEAFLKQLSPLDFRNYVVLIKGARKYKFERITRALQQKAHRTVLEIDLNAIKHNLDYFRSFLKPQTKIMVMVKAFSYGSGSFEIANFLQQERVDYLGVAIEDEAVELREAGIKLPIIVMNPEPKNVEIYVDYGLEPEIYSFRVLEKFYTQLKNKLHYPLPVHIKINTGMNRLGFDLDEVDELIGRLRAIKDVLSVKSVFSHLVGSPEPEFDEFTLKQIAEFQKVVEKFKNNFGQEVIAHILNSGGIERFSDYQMDMVRLGIGLYGISAIDNNRLKQISTLKTKIAQIRKVKAGESIGYSRAEYVKRDSLIAVLPIGYADGLNRRLSRGKGKVWVKGRLVPIVGNICMDMTMIDVTDVPDVKEDDEVIIFGPQLPIWQLAQWLDTIPYEVLTSVSHRVKRIYKFE